ncbi:uncharacterized protein LOC130719606 [Lotus japonicus]|uniref:uncharacterized protein LOC130719606 n=1 Tax=Lotus japonicus TaxID=34305 RepID=UPI0025905BBE|nr:uncharacterized protein LOC130719606 [Lotus japonicus]
MAIALRYANKTRSIVERFLGIVHVKDTTASSLKSEIDELLCKHGLSISSIRGQVAIAQEHGVVSFFFNFVSKLMNVVGGSCKRFDMLHEKQWEHIREELSKGEISSGQGLNQETNLARSADTRWSSHYVTLVRIILMYFSIIDVLDIMKEDRYPRQANVLEFASFYPNEFTPFNLVMFDNALDCYIVDMHTSDEFAFLEGLQQLSKKLVEKGRHVVLRNRIGDTWMNDCLVTYIESDVFNNIDFELIVQRFQNMKSRRE